MLSIRNLLSVNTPIMLLTVTATEAVQTYWSSNIRLRDPVALCKTSINRPNPTYAVHPLLGTSNDPRNLRFLIPRRILIGLHVSIEEILACTPTTIVFMGDRQLIAASPLALYSQYPISVRVELMKIGFGKGKGAMRSCK